MGRKKKSSDEFKNEVKLLTDDEYEVLGEYINTETKIKIKHNVCGSEFEITPHNFLNKHRCPICSGWKKTTRSFIKEVFDLTQNEYEVVSEYINSDTKIKFLHHKCGNTFEMLPKNFLKGCRCTACKSNYTSNINENNRKNRYKTNKYFKQEVYKLVKNEYEIIGDYEGSNKKVKIRHAKCGFEFEMTPNNFLHNHRCPKCAGKLKKDTNYFKKEVFQLVENEYSVVGEYQGNNRKIRFIHNNCKNEFEMTPSNFIRSKYCRCPACRIYAYNKNTEMFKKEVSELVGNEYVVCGNYVNNHTKIKFKHICGYEFNMRPNNFLNGCRCPKCQISSSKGEQLIEKFLSENNIRYAPQKKFNDLIGVGGGKLSYDFYIPDYNFLIEYQGEQHKRCFDFFGGESRLINQQIHDNRKREYAKLRNINLLEIWYYDFNNIKNILEENLLKQKCNNITN